MEHLHGALHTQAFIYKMVLIYVLDSTQYYIKEGIDHSPYTLHVGKQGQYKITRVISTLSTLSDIRCENKFPECNYKKICLYNILAETVSVTTKNLPTCVANDQLCSGDDITLRCQGQYSSFRLFF